MKFNFVKVLVFSLILGLVPVFTACNKADDLNSLKQKYKVVIPNFKKPFEEGKIQIFGKVTGGTNPNIVMVLSDVFKPSPELQDVRMPVYTDFDGSEYPKYLLDDGFIPVTNNFYIIVNNDGNELYNVQLYVDINGETGPNRLGHDLFKYNLEAGDKLVPMDENFDIKSNREFFES